MTLHDPSVTSLRFPFILKKRLSKKKKKEMKKCRRALDRTFKIKNGDGVPNACVRSHQQQQPLQSSLSLVCLEALCASRGSSSASCFGISVRDYHNLFGFLAALLIILFVYENHKCVNNILLSYESPCQAPR